MCSAISRGARVTAEACTHAFECVCVCMCVLVCVHARVCVSLRAHPRQLESLCVGKQTPARRSAGEEGGLGRWSKQVGAHPFLPLHH